MFNSHIFSRFLRLVRSIRRSLFAFFVAIAMLLATFVIAPTSALSAGENAGVTENTVGAKSDSAKKADGEKQQTKQSESNNTEFDKNNNKESNPVEKPKTAGNNGVDKAKSDSAVNKNVKDAQKKGVDSAAATNGTDRSTKGKPELPSECKSNMEEFGTFEKCYSITYYGTKNVKKTENKLDIKGNGNEPYNRVPQIITPTIKVAGKEQKTLPDGVWLELEKYSNDDSVNYAFFKGENDNYTAKSTKKVANSDGSIRFFVSKWMAAKTYKFKFVIHYPDGSESKAKKIIAKLAKDDLPKPKSDDLKLSLYDFVNKQDDVAVSGNKITIKPKSNSQGASGGTAGSTDKKDVYDSINKLFIDSQSIDKRGELYHHIICNDGANNYTVDSVNGLSLKDKKDNPSEEKQTQFKHMDGENRPSKDAADSAVYENDDYIERSQSWITGTPTKSGTFECKVFAIKKDDEFKLERNSGNGKTKVYSTVLDEFDTRVETNKQSLFEKPEQNIVEDKWTNKASIKQGIDWDYKKITIQFGDKPKPPEILTLKVYPFNGSPTALSEKNNKISAMIGMELKPFIDATSAADSKNKITLRVLCSKGEKKKDNAGGGASTGGTGSSGSGSAGSGSSGTNIGAVSQSEQPSEPSQPSQTAGSPQAEEPLEYKTWSSNLAELGLSVPEDTKQTRCNKANDGDKECTAKNVASQTSMEVSIKPAEVGDYQCVVFALKPKALETFDGLKGSLTPESIKSTLTAAPASFKEHKDFAAFTLNIHSVSNFTLPHTGGQSWNLQLGILAALLVNLLAAGFVVSQGERGRKLIFGRWRGLCNHV